MITGYLPIYYERITGQSRVKRDRTNPCLTHGGPYSTLAPVVSLPHKHAFLDTDMTTNAEILGDHEAQNRAWYRQIANGWARWLRAGGQLGEWTEDTITDIQFASQALFLNDGDRILNLSCGWGRHAITLAHFGLEVIGLEASPELLELAKETSHQANVDDVEWVCGQLSDLKLERPVNAVVQFNDNLLSWAEGPADALHILDQIHATLRRGGRFLFGRPNWTATLPETEQSQAETIEGQEIYHHFFDPETRTARFQTIVIDRRGQRSEFWRHSWHPTAEQMGALLYQAGFLIEGQFNSFDYLPYDPNQIGLVWLVQKQ